MNRKFLVSGLVAAAAGLITMVVFAAGGAGGDIEKVDLNPYAVADDSIQMSGE